MLDRLQAMLRFDCRRCGARAGRSCTGWHGRSRRRPHRDRRRALWDWWIDGPLAARQPDEGDRPRVMVWFTGLPQAFAEACRRDLADTVADDLSRTDAADAVAVGQVLAFWREVLVERARAAGVAVVPEIHYVVDDTA